MAFFKTSRDRLKGNALVSHLEFANQFFDPKNMIRCEQHIRDAQKALGDFRRSEAEYIFSDEGWQYLATLAEPLQIALGMGGFAHLESDVQHIVDYVHGVLAVRGIPHEPLENPFGKTDSQTPAPPPVPRERLWVGDIVGLLMAHMRDFGMHGIETWTIVIEGDGDDQYVALYGGLPGPDERLKRHCMLGQCDRLARVVECHRSPPFVLEVAVQDLAFEICKRAEPKWDEIIRGQSAQPSESNQTGIP